MTLQNSLARASPEVCGKIFHMLAPSQDGGPGDACLLLPKVHAMSPLPTPSLAEISQGTGYEKSAQKNEGNVSMSTSELNVINQSDSGLENAASAAISLVLFGLMFHHFSRSGIMYCFQHLRVACSLAFLLAELRKARLSWGFSLPFVSCRMPQMAWQCIG